MTYTAQTDRRRKVNTDIVLEGTQTRVNTAPTRSHTRTHAGTAHVRYGHFYANVLTLFFDKFKDSRYRTRVPPGPR